MLNSRVLPPVIITDVHRQFAVKYTSARTVNLEYELNDHINILKLQISTIHIKIK